MKQHEQSTIDGFVEYARMVSRHRKHKFIPASLDGQDNLLNADYLFSNTTKFILTEFKYNKTSIKLERKKKNCQNMCLKLDNDIINKLKHDECHYIAWNESTNNEYHIFLNNYFNEVCNQTNLNNDSLRELEPIVFTRINVEKFINNFFDNRLGLNFDEFDLYIQWLLDYSDPTGSGQIELLINNSTIDKFSMLRFKSIGHLLKWIKKKYLDKDKKQDTNRSRNNNRSRGR
jgi:hypothetical protein